MNDILKRISDIGIVPVIKLDDAKNAAPLARALCRGGLPCAEVTFRTDACVESIKLMKKECPDMIVGAGTVLTTKQVDEAIEAGAEFIVSPGLNPDVVKYCVDKGITITPGCSNPSDIEQAIKYGLDVVKFFPAEAAGGLKMIKSMAAPYGNIKFFPTGGINADNITEYLSYNRVICCGGTWMVPSDLIEQGNFDGIEALTREAVENMFGFKIAHVGINCDTPEEAHGVADSFESIFGFSQNENPSSIFGATSVEIMKMPFLGKHGHIAIVTNFVERAVKHLESKGVKFNEESAVYRPDGSMQAIYLKNEIGGFAVHLVRKPQ
ncbi:MAG: bifunctional 4-hydroxy-2-oxoglutarate aldolase/2-dehydro-3-deoxy-phosphogluconate aldolase [Clostridium sp.]|uniref:bifunctional 4-hydroxy-2-oxoglutarate aldolase/2-dehydro-3-deoxy-phosphogluconate aldolase n=1 Tax=Clostridium sp. TaxID=1506 RepID=UPI002A8F3BA2|nr:bifunctional 4-hydroxy-2-oxoglutarate aldolase/2-dehydro-3-deoxy-phosphogluconate aldolase [Clostridium sp.]MDY5096851.1 bifunctional 4-hydroxy-2-oxoglutarate aldolase/2-dehydro-3-deoxy-phosphogluconate aldolase [Clostridium sp.]